MKTRSASPTRSALVAAAAATAIFAACPAIAADQTYDDTGVDVWDLATVNWDLSTVAWTNGNNAIFGGFGESVSINAAIQAGDITFDTTYTLAPGTGSLTLANPSNTLSVTNASDTATLSLPLAGPGAALLKGGSGKVIFTTANTYNAGTTISAGTLQLGEGDTTGSLSTSGAIVNDGTLAFDRSNAVIQGTDFSAAPVTGTGGLGLVGTGPVTLTAANTFSGGTTVNAASGGLVLGHALAVQNSTVTNNRAEGITFASGIGSFTAGALAGNFSPLTLADSAAVPVSLAVGGNGATTNLTTILKGAGSLVKNGAGTLNLIAPGAFAVTGAAFGSTAVSLLSPAHVEVGQLVTGTSVPGNTRITAIGGVDNLDLTLSNPITSASGSGLPATLTISGNLHSGGTTINAGAVRIGYNSAHNAGIITSGPLGTGTVTMSGGVLGSSAGNSFANNLTVTGDIAIGSAALGGRVVHQGPLDLGGGSRNITLIRKGTAATRLSSGLEAYKLEAGTAGPAVSLLNGTARFIVDPSVTGTDYVGVRFNTATAPGNPGLTLGDRIISVVIPSSGPFGTGANAGPKMILESGSYFNLSDGGVNSRPFTAFSLSGSGTVTNFDTNGVTGTGAGNSLLTISGSDSTTFSGTITNGAALNASLGLTTPADSIVSLTTSGTGTLNLTGANTYSGITTVSGGSKLLVNNSGGSATGTGNVTVTSISTLGGAGTIGGTVTAAGNVAPGNSAGTLTTGAATLTGNLVIEIDGGTGDKLVSTGALNITGCALQVSLLPGGFIQPSYVIAEGAPLTGTFNVVPPGYSVSYTPTQAILSQGGASAYDTWTASFPTLADPDFEDDFDNDGLDTGLEWILGGNPTLSSSPVAPTVSRDLSNNLILTFTREEDAIAETTLTLEYDTDLAGTWTSAVIDQDGGNLANGVVVTVNQAASPDAVTVTIPASNAAAGKLFARLRATRP